jgi:hypothetical protein
MLKVLFRTLIILLVAALVAGGVYLFAVNGGMSLLGGVGQASHGIANGSGLPRAGTFAPLAGGGRFDHDQNGFSLAGLGGVAVQAGKVAALTTLVLAIKGILQAFKRRRKHSRLVAL